jgi:hypothetical protein
MSTCPPAALLSLVIQALLYPVSDWARPKCLAVAALTSSIQTVNTVLRLNTDAGPC